MSRNKAAKSVNREAESNERHKDTLEPLLKKDFGRVPGTISYKICAANHKEDRNSKHKK